MTVNQSSTTAHAFSNRKQKLGTEEEEKESIGNYYRTRVVFR